MWAKEFRQYFPGRSGLLEILLGPFRVLFINQLSVRFAFHTEAPPDGWLCED
jgi:hypothetical protein